MNLSKTSTVQTRDGHTVPVLGLGVYQEIAKGEVQEAVLAAIKNGYRLLDTSPLYR